MTKKLIQLAKEQRSRDSPTGPWGIRGYCCGEPSQTKRRCLIVSEIPCKYFRDAVLALRPELQPESKIIPRTDLGPDIFVSAASGIDGRVLFLCQGLQQTVAFVDRASMQKVNAFLADNGRAEDAIAYATHDASLLDQPT